MSTNTFLIPLKKQNIENEIMILSIGKEKSEYFSQSAYAVDSVLSENFKEE